MRSMTGFGVEENADYIIEIKSVNHRFLDIKFNSTHSLRDVEDKITKMIPNYFVRGRIEVNLKLLEASNKNKHLVTNWSLMDQYIEQYELARKRYNLEGEITPQVLFSLPDLFVIHEENEQPTEQVTAILNSVERVCYQVLRMREEEGKYLADDIKNRVKTVQDMLLLIKQRRPQVISEYRERIHQRLNDYTKGTLGLETQLFHQEIALLAEKGDISEEITRMESHMNHIYELIEMDESIGRKLDFIIQEMHREVNTIGSKSKDQIISHWTVTIKSELEKIKEQIQNIE